MWNVIVPTVPEFFFNFFQRFYDVVSPPSGLIGLKQQQQQFFFTYSMYFEKSFLLIPKSLDELRSHRKSCGQVSWFNRNHSVMWTCCNTQTFEISSSQDYQKMSSMKPIQLQRTFIVLSQVFPEKILPRHECLQHTRVLSSESLNWFFWISHS